MEYDLHTNLMMARLLLVVLKWCECPKCLLPNQVERYFKCIGEGKYLVANTSSY